MGFSMPTKPMEACNIVQVLVPSTKSLATEQQSVSLFRSRTILLVKHPFILSGPCATSSSAVSNPVWAWAWGISQGVDENRRRIGRRLEICNTFSLGLHPLGPFDATKGP